MRATRLLVPVAALALLAGCSDAEGSDPTPEPDRVQAEDLPEKVSTGDDASDDGTSDGDASGNGAKPGEDKPDAPAGDVAACMLGAWDADMSTLESAALASMGTNLDTFAASVEVTGGQVDTIGPDTIAVKYLGQRVAVSMTVDGTQLDIVTTFAGELVTSYILDGDVLTTVGGDMTAVTIDSATYLNGVETEIPGYAEQMDATMSGMTATAGQVRIICSADSLTQVPIVGGTEIPGLASTFTRR